MDRRDFLGKSLGFAAVGGLMLMGCGRHSEVKKKKFSVVADRCSGCGKCFKACEEKAIRFEGNKAVIDQARCEGCGDCKERCRREAIVQVS